MRTKTITIDRATTTIVIIITNIITSKSRAEWLCHLNEAAIN